VSDCLEQSSAVDRASFIDSKHKYDGYTALMRAVAAGHLECVKILMEHGASWAIRNAEGKNVMTIAREARQKDVLVYLMELGVTEPLSLD